MKCSREKIIWRLVLGHNILRRFSTSLCRFLALLDEQTILSAVVHQGVATLVALFDAMDCPAHAIHALASFTNEE